MNRTDISRRTFIKNSVGMASLFLDPCQIWHMAIHSNTKNNAKNLVVIHLVGGNDGLNMVVPYGLGAYYDARPFVRIKQKDVLPLDNKIGLHPNMSKLFELYKRGNLASIQAVGYPNPSRSHFRSAQVWQTGRTEGTTKISWLERYNHTKSKHRKIHLDNLPSFSLDVVENHKSNFLYPHGQLANSLRFVAQMINDNVNSNIYCIRFNGFDIHTDQMHTHSMLLKQLSEALYAFQTDLQLNKKDGNVLTLVFSEFGRRIFENASKGTDHGTAQPILVIGSSINGGVYGDHPNLNKLDSGDLKFEIDFRTIYATLLDRWLCSDSSEILGNRFEHLLFI